MMRYQHIPIRTKFLKIILIPNATQRCVETGILYIADKTVK
jgi:hypothetical protein